jgi:hypothetical protein
MSFGASVFCAVALGEEMVCVSGWGTAAVRGKAFAPVAAIAPPTRTANFAAMPLRNIFLSLCIMDTLRFKKRSMDGIVYPVLPGIAVFLPGVNRSMTFARGKPPRDANEVHKHMISNDLGTARISRTEGPIG